jgi:hypothetical protein
MILSIRNLTIFVCILWMLSFAAGPDGFNNAAWGFSPDQVKNAVNAQGWQSDGSSVQGFPQPMNVAVFKSLEMVAGYKAVVKYYFYENKLFQTTVVFNFDEMKKFDFNYNVFRSVNEYYLFIRSKSIVFVNNIYDLLCKKYGKKEPVFKGLDPRFMFVNLDKYLKQERWNLRYHPYDYYLHIATNAYARWDFPRTRVIFSIALSASEKRFDYQLSLTSLDLEPAIQKKIDELRMKGL